jgi:uncharacterized linocin/CFP29 family protein
MHNDLVELGWTEEHWSRVSCAVAEEAQRARVAAQLLPIVGPVDPSVMSVPTYALGNAPAAGFSPPLTRSRLSVNSNPTLSLTTLAVNVPLHTREAADPELNAALVMFRRAANLIARFEDALVFNGRPANANPFNVGAPVANLVQVTGGGATQGLLPAIAPAGARSWINVATAISRVAGAVAPALGDRVVAAIVQAISALEANGQFGPFACALSPALFQAISTPSPALVLPRDRILPFLQGPLLRSSVILGGANRPSFGVVLASSGNPLELVVGSDIRVRYLQTTEEPRIIFRVSERVALRIKNPEAIAILF